MKRSTFISLFLAAQVLFVISLIHKQSLFIKASFAHQKNEQRKIKLQQERGALQHELIDLTSRSRAQTHAHQELGMEKVRLSSVKKMGA